MDAKRLVEPARAGDWDAGTISIPRQISVAFTEGAWKWESSREIFYSAVAIVESGLAPDVAAQIAVVGEGRFLPELGDHVAPFAFMRAVGVGIGKRGVLWISRLCWDEEVEGGKHGSCEHEHHGDEVGNTQARGKLDDGF